MMFGGSVPGGSTRRLDAEFDAASAIARLMSALWVEKDLYHRDAVQRLRLDMLDVVDTPSQRPFVIRRNAAGHVLRGKAVIRPDDADDGDVDIGEDVCRRTQYRERAGDKDHHGEDH
jgi:hypothetical protein